MRCHKWNHVYWTEWLTEGMMGSSSTSYSYFGVTGRIISSGNSSPPSPCASRMSPEHPDRALLDQGKLGSILTYKSLLQEANQCIKDSTGDLIASLGFQPRAALHSSDFFLEVVAANYFQLSRSWICSPWEFGWPTSIDRAMDQLLWKSKIREIWTSWEGHSLCTGILPKSQL